MFVRMQVPQSESQPPRTSNNPTEKQIAPPHFPPISEDLVKLRAETQFIPFIISTTLRAEESPNGLPPLSLAEAQDLIEILDNVRLPNLSLSEC